MKEKNMARSRRWILDWQDRSRDPNRRILVTADTIDEVRQYIEELLAVHTWTPEDAIEFKGPDASPAFDAFKQN